MPQGLKVRKSFLTHCEFPLTNKAFTAIELTRYVINKVKLTWRNAVKASSRI